MAALTVIVAVLLSYGVYYAQGLPIEEHTISTLCTYEQKTKGDYTAYLKPNILYGETIGEGEPIYLNLLDYIDAIFHYDFECSETGDITTQYKITSILTPTEGWSKSINEVVSVEKSETTTATSAVLEAKLSYNITEITELIDKIEEEISVSSSLYQITTTININTTDTTSVGTVSKPIEEYIVLKLNYVGGYIERGGVITVEVPESHLPGSITENSTTEITSASQFRMGMSVALFAWIGVSSLFTIWRYKDWKTTFEALPESEKIMKRFNVVESKDMPNLNVQTLASIDDLNKIADDYDSRLFHTKMGDNDVFFTTIENITYQYVVNASAQMFEATFSNEKPSKSINSSDLIKPQKKALQVNVLKSIISRSNFVFLAFIGSGLFLLAFSAWIVYYDITVWDKNLSLILLGSRAGEAIALGINMRLIYYFIIGLTLISMGIILFLLPKYRNWRNARVLKIRS
jgi:hypothetical protein